MPNKWFVPKVFMPGHFVSALHINVLFMCLFGKKVVQAGMFRCNVYSVLKQKSLTIMKLETGDSLSTFKMYLFSDFDFCLWYN